MNQLQVAAQQQLVPPCHYFPSPLAIIQIQTPSRKRSRSSCMATSVKKVQKMSREAFKLPVFSTDIEKCIRKDAFYTSAQRNKLIREAWRALQGYCREQDRPVSNDEKRMHLSQP